MAYTITINHPAGDYVFAITPDFVPDLNFRHNRLAEPPVLASVEEIWNIKKAYIVNAVTSDLLTDYSNLTAKLKNRAQQVTGIQFKNGVTIVQEMSQATHRGFEMLTFKMSDDPGTWNNYLCFDISAHGYLGLVDGAGSGSGQNQTANVSEISLKLDYKYTKEGFLTKTLSGTLLCETGVAETRARSYTLPLPDATYFYVTKGPEGVDVVLEDYPANRRASFTCTIQQTGDTLLPNVYTLVVKIKTESFARYTITTTSVEAVALSAQTALDAVIGALPNVGTGIIAYEAESDASNRSASGSAQLRTPLAKGAMTTSLDYSATVKGRLSGIQEFRFPGTADPALLRKSRSAIVVVESARIQCDKKILETDVQPAADTSIDGEESSFQESIVENSGGTGKYTSYAYQINTVHKYPNAALVNLPGLYAQTTGKL